MTGLSSGTMYQLYLKSHCSSETGSWSAPRTFTTLAACPTPINLTLMSHTAEEATISWMPGATESSWEVVCVPHGDPVYSGTPTVVYNSPYTISNLIDNTPYDVYVRARCDYDTTRWSAWSDTLHMHIATYGIDDVEAPEVTLAPNPTDGRLAVR